jgi:hypothetical protein
VVCKSLEQSDLLVTEQLDFGAPDGDYANGLVCADQWDGQCGAVAKASRIVAALWVLLPAGLQIGDVNCSLIENGTSHNDLAIQGKCADCWDHTIVSHEGEKVAVYPTDHRVKSIAKASRDLCEHALQVHG